MRCPDFARGVADARAGKAPAFDAPYPHTNNAWAYERGRQWASIAPLGDVPLRVNGKLNPAAKKYFRGVI